MNPLNKRFGKLYKVRWDKLGRATYVVRNAFINSSTTPKVRGDLWGETEGRNGRTFWTTALCVVSNAQCLLGNGLYE